MLDLRRDFLSRGTKLKAQISSWDSTCCCFGWTPTFALVFCSMDERNCGWKGLLKQYPINTFWTSPRSSWWNTLEIMVEHFICTDLGNKQANNRKLRGFACRVLCNGRCKELSTPGSLLASVTVVRRWERRWFRLSNRGVSAPQCNRQTSIIDCGTKVGFGSEIPRMKKEQTKRALSLCTGYFVPVQWEGTAPDEK